MIKVLYLPLGQQLGMIDAWRNVGVTLETYDFLGVWESHNKNKDVVARLFLEKVRDFQPNLIHMQLQFTGVIQSHTLEEARKICPGVIMTNWSGDVRDRAIPDFTRIAGALDYSLISSTGQLTMYKNAGCNNIRYWQIGYDPKKNFPLNYQNFDYDISFIGNNYGNTFPDSRLRSGTTSALSSEFGRRFGIFGSGYGSHTRNIQAEQNNEIYNKSICTLSISNFNDVSHYFSDRLLYCLASGRPTISWYFPGIESYFVEGSEIFIARSAKEVIDAVKYCKAHPEVAAQVGINGHKRVLKEHTFTSRVIELLHITKLIHLV
jgi:spore maturation protein CgeB